MLIGLCLAIPYIWKSQAQQSEYLKMKTEAERFYKEGSYARAYEIYEKVDKKSLLPEESRWVEFRLADTLWRNLAKDELADNSKLEQARRQLEALVRDILLVEDRDLVWAEVEESLGDYWWIRQNYRNWGSAQPYYLAALDWWAGAKDIDLARSRYIKIIKKIAFPPSREPYYYYGYYGNYLPLQIAEDFLKIAQTENDKAYAHYLLAMSLMSQGGDWESRQRIGEEFQSAIKFGKATEWYDDALYKYAYWLETNGKFISLEDGNYRTEPDYAGALAVYRKLLAEFKKGETRYHDQAEYRVKEITRAYINLGVSNIFLPDSEIDFHLSWRNLSKIELSLYKVDLINSTSITKSKNLEKSWLEAIQLEEKNIVKTIIKERLDKEEFRPSSENVRISEKLPVGAYILQAKAEKSADAVIDKDIPTIVRDLVLITDASLVMKSSSRQAVFFYCNASTGEPIAGANIKFLQQAYADKRGYYWEERTSITNQDGIAEIPINEKNVYQLIAFASLGDRQAFVVGGYNRYYDSENLDEWRIYAHTDRPAYRPNEIVQWKFVARRYNGQTYSTPANQVVELEITDPKGSKIKEEKVNLNAFGSGWGSVELKDSMPLGEYRVTFWTEKRSRQIGYATLFRMEEYKLPEFKVSVETPQEDGKTKAFRLGEKVEVNIQADYYFGGAVANADVEVVVYQNYFYPFWQPVRDYSWFYEDFNPYRNYYNQGSVIKREKLKTDAVGKASLFIETPRGGQDFEYRIEARVIDSSRREIIGKGNVRVTKQRYYVYERPQNYLYKPQDKVKIDVKAQDANDQPVEVEGKVKVTRDYWFEIWLDPTGREVKGEELKKLQESSIFPPPSPPNSPGWRLKFRGYQHDEILTTTVKTDKEGKAEISFIPEREGYYNVAWVSPDKNAPPVKANTTVWVLTNRSTDLGYRKGGLEIIVDKDTFRAGQKAAVMIATAANNRYVLFSIEADGIYSYQLVRMTGNVKLIEIDVEERHVPNSFLSAAMVTDQQIFVDTKEIVIPPVKNFLTVEIKPDRTQYKPQEEGSLLVKTFDQDGRPTSAEVALGLVDEAVYYIQQDYAGDPRQFYFGKKRYNYVTVQSTFQQKPYVKLLPELAKSETVISDDRSLPRDEMTMSEEVGIEGGVEGDGVVGRVIGGVVGGKAAGAVADSVVPPPPPPSPPASQPAKKAVSKESELSASGNELKDGDKQQEAAVQVRSDFRSTIIWQPNVVTGTDGSAIVKVKYPDSLTGWKATARAVSTGNQFGISSATTRTKQPLIVRLQAPRFFVVGDLVTISGVINNNTDKPIAVTPSLVADGLTLSSQTTGKKNLITVESNGETRVDWQVSVPKAGAAKLKVVAQSKEYSDAMEKEFVIHEHGIEKFIGRAGKVRGEDVSFSIDIPKDRKPETTELVVQVAPSIAATMLDSLPYLIDYPYGCTEQTMSRFLPAAITARTLKTLGVQPEEVMGRVFGGIVQENASKTNPTGKKDLKKLDDMIEKGLARLYDFQHSDGGWGWWKEGDSDHYMTAYVLWGLALAKQGGVTIKPQAMQNAYNYLDRELVEEELNLDQQAWMLHALAFYNNVEGQKSSQSQKKAFQNIYTQRDRINAYTRALLALSSHYLQLKDEALVLVRNLEDGVKFDKSPDTSIIQQTQQPSLDSIIATAHWGEDSFYWRWSDGPIESTSFVLRALLAIDPNHRLIEPSMNWLVKNRRGAQWSNTRDTAIAVLSLNDYLKVSKELAPEVEYELLVNNNSIVSKRLTAADALSAPSLFKIDNKFIKDGANQIRIKRRNGNSPVYFATQAKFFTLEDNIKSAGNEIFVRRQYYRYIGRPTLLKGYTYDKELLSDGDLINSGDRIETVITIETKNNYEYLLFEDLKPAGLEAVQIRSGEPLYAMELKSSAVDRKFADENAAKQAASKAQGRVSKQRIAPTPPSNPNYTGRSSYIYQELRDRKVALFITKLSQGVWEVRYTMRAEAPGKFSALPVLGHAMYVPEIRCNGDEIKMKIEDK